MQMPLCPAPPPPVQYVWAQYMDLTLRAAASPESCNYWSGFEIRRRPLHRSLEFLSDNTQRTDSTDATTAMQTSVALGPRMN